MGLCLLIFMLRCLFALLCAAVIAPAADVPSTAAVAVRPAVEVKLVFDDQADEEKLKAFGARSLALIKEWEPKIAVILGTVEAKRPKVLTVRFKDMDGVAFWDGKAITVSTRYAAKHPDDVFLVVHELTHVLQGYRKTPSWMTEGIADYVRFGVAEEGKFGIRIDPVKNKPRDSYRVTGYLILQAEKRYPGLVKKLQLAGVAGTDVEKTWVDHCGGKSVDEVWADCVLVKTK